MNGSNPPTQLMCRLIGEFSLLHFNHHHALYGIVVFVHGDNAGNPGKVPGVGQGLGDTGAVETPCLLYGLAQQKVAVRPQRGEGIQFLVIFGFIDLQKFAGQVSGRPLAVEMGGEVHALMGTFIPSP